ncbi:hypothetical protein J31TS4_11120 [Paenibacillus sp. J31TS4]|uniref:response regulator transcription factor n=1 Tax=Paenibacillus sp. J31TS4 TaxID=2807195 RepID=UPI001B13B224|nr:LuxR C-terminal-related transcriptional regulator [Paenibacillus sp. J31TS4]GIP37832.1 hypothetical protein J31TS4_11120 [Paenibacillus sp. J31TS4]
MRTGTLTDPLSQVTNQLERDYRLTMREIELLRAISLQGWNNRQLAQHFHITEKTVQNHLANMMRKTGTSSSRELMALMMRKVLYTHTA